MRVIPVLVVLGTLAAHPSGADPGPAKHHFTVDDMWAVKRVGAPVASPDRSLVAYTVSTWDADENRSKGVPARLAYYPDENHWILKGANSKHWYGEVLGWLDRWLR